MMKQIRLIIILTLCCSLLFSCSAETYPELDTDIQLIGENNAFSFTLQSFIDQYNRLCEIDGKDERVRPRSGWERFEYNDSPFCVGEYWYYRYNADPTVLTHPTITAYIPADTDAVYALTVDFDDHGYSRELYEIYEEQCYYTLKALLPDCPDEDITEIIAELNRLANENMSLEPLSADTVPLIIYHTDTVGVFSYFAQGDYVHICIIPVTSDYLEKMEQMGAELREIM